MCALLLPVPARVHRISDVNGVITDIVPSLSAAPLRPLEASEQLVVDMLKDCLSMVTIGLAHQTNLTIV